MTSAPWLDIDPSFTKTFIPNTTHSLRVVIADANGPVIHVPKTYEDERGHFFSSYTEDMTPGIRWVQDNCSFSKYGVLRGLHFQKPPYEQAKLVRCVSGAIYDVVVDLRPGSNTYLEARSFLLSAENRAIAFIPKGFAHGFIVVSPEGASVAYKVDEFYAKAYEDGLRYNDPRLGLRWPMDPIVNERDANWPLIAVDGTTGTDRLIYLNPESNPGTAPN